jgi:hypothetical protein
MYGKFNRYLEKKELETDWKDFWVKGYAIYKKGCELRSLLD